MSNTMKTTGVARGMSRSCIALLLLTYCALATPNLSAPNWTMIKIAHSWKCLKRMAGTTGLEPAASAVTGQRSNQLNYDPKLVGGEWIVGTSHYLPTTTYYPSGSGRCRIRTCDTRRVKPMLYH